MCETLSQTLPVTSIRTPNPTLLMIASAVGSGTLTISEDNLGKLLAGKLNPMTGVMLGKLKVSGDLGVAMGLAKLLS